MKNKSATTDMIPIIYGPNDDELPLVGFAVLAVKSLLREPFNIPYFVDAVVNGEIVSVDYRLQSGDRLEFDRRFGFKGAGDEDVNDREADGLLWAYPDLQQIAEKVKASGKSGPQAIDLMTRLVAEWCRDKFGPLENRINGTLERLIEKMDKMTAPDNSDLNQIETNILQALGDKTMKAETLAKVAGYFSCNQNFRTACATLVRRRLLGNKRGAGYYRLKP